jgi:hypothetical protein
VVFKTARAWLVGAASSLVIVAAAAAAAILGQHFWGHHFVRRQKSLEGF